MKKIRYLFLILSFLFFYLCDLILAQDTETLTLVTYYPAPYGVYRELSFVRLYRQGAILYGNDASKDTHINLGETSVTGASGSNRTYCTVSGGKDNIAGGDSSTVSGGQSNVVNKAWSTIGGGWGNRVDEQYSTIGGGQSNRTTDWRAFIGGGEGNYTGAGHNITIGGGAYNSVSGYYSAIGGGRENDIDTGYSTIGGGRKNKINTPTIPPPNYYYATIGGGENNIISNGSHSTIGGGESNSISVSSDAVIGGGWNNQIINSSATIGGGKDNIASGGGGYTTIAGGAQNHTEDEYATVGGGLGNDAIENSATVGGGKGNYASGEYSTIPGGRNNTAAGNYSFAAGRRAKANHSGCFVWADGQNADYTSTNTNQFRVRAQKGAYFTDKVYAGVDAGTSGRHMYAGDIAEIIPCARDVEPGDVVVANPDKDQEVIRATKTNDFSVAGVISGDPILCFGDIEKFRGKTENPQYLALAGQVYVKADATYGEINRGDLLTSSPTPGHAMKAKPIGEINGFPIYPQGCIIGKALQPLKEGKDKILVLVCLM